MRKIADGKVTISTALDNKGIEKGVKKVPESLGGLKKAVGGIAKAIAVSFAAVSVAAVDLVKRAVEAYADYEQLTGGVETLFKDSASKVMAYAEDAFYTAGLSTNEYMETVTSFSASLISSLKGDTEKAADIANMALIDMSDNANKMGSTMESVQAAYQGFAKQQYTLLDNLKLGYGGTKTEMERLLKDAEAYSGVKYDINNLGDVYNAIHAIQEKLDITGTTAKEAEKTITGSAQMTKAAWKNVLTAIAGGGDLDKAINNLVYSISKCFQNVLPVVQRSLRGIGQLIAEIAPQLVETVAIALIQAIPDLLNAVYKMIIGIANGIYQGIIALFTGKSTIGEVTAQLNGVSASAGSATDSTEDLADAMTEADKAAKKAKKTLAGFDELNLLQDKNSGSGSSGTDAIVSSVGGITSSVTSSMEEIAESEGITFLDILWDKISRILKPLQEIDFGPAQKALSDLGYSFLGLSDSIGRYLEFAWFEILAPLAKWTIEEAAPALIGALAGAFDVLGAVLDAVFPWLEAVWNNFLQPIAEWTGGVIVDVLNGLAGAFKDLAAWISGDDYTVLSDAEKQLIKDANDAAAAFENQRQKTKEAMDAVLKENGELLALAGRLDELVDANGRVDEANAATVDYILKELNEALGTEYERVGYIVEGYRELKTSIEDVIKQRTIEQLLEKSSEDYTTALTEKNKAWNAQMLALKELEGVKTRINELEAEDIRLSEEAKELHAQGWHETAALIERQALTARDAAAELVDDLEGAQKAYDDAETNYRQYAETVIEYENAQRLAAEGHYETAIDILTEKEDAFAEYAESVAGSMDDAATAAENELARMIAAAKQAAYDAKMEAEEYKKNYEKGVAGYTKEGLKELEDAHKKTLRELEALSGDVKNSGQSMSGSYSEGIQIGFKKSAKKVGEASNEVLEAAEKPWEAAEQKGEAQSTRQTKGITTGFKKSLQEVGAAANEVLEAAEKPWETAEQKGEALSTRQTTGITTGFKKSVQEVGAAANEVLEAAEKPWETAEQKGEALSTRQTTGIKTGFEKTAGGVARASGKVYEDMCDEWSTAEVDGQGLAKNYSDGVSDGLQNGFKNAFRNAANAAIGVLNSLISWINNALKFTIPELKILGTQLWPKKTVKLANLPAIPYLAQGAVLPANKPFMAVVGDQRHGTNVEAPLTTIQEAVANVMNENLSAMMAGFNALLEENRLLRQVVEGIEVGDTVIGQASQRYMQKMAIMRGGQW